MNNIHISKKSILSLTFLAIGLFCIGQGSVSLTGAGNQHDTEAWLNRNKLRNFNEPDGFVGDIYLGGDWLTGSITTMDGRVLDKVRIKYDMRSDLLIADINNVQFVLQTLMVQKFTAMVGGKPKQFHGKSVAGRPAYLELIYDGDTKLFVKHSVKKIAKDPGTQAYGSGVAYDKYVTEYTYYTIKEEQLIQFKPSKKTIVQLMEDRSDQIKGYMKKSKLNPKSEDDLTQIFRYYDQSQ